MKAGRFKEAIKPLSMATESKPDFSKAFNSLGETYEKLGNYSKALKAFNKAINLDRNYTIAYSHLGKIYTIQKEYVKVKRWCRITN